MEKPEYCAAIAGRYCLRVFSELNEKPFAVELDLRGIYLGKIHVAGCWKQWFQLAVLL